MRNPGDQRRRLSAGTDRGHTRSHTPLICSYLGHAATIIYLDGRSDLNFSGHLLEISVCFHMRIVKFWNNQKESKVPVHFTIGPHYTGVIDLNFEIRHRILADDEHIFGHLFVCEIWCRGKMILCPERAICGISMTQFMGTVVPLLRCLQISPLIPFSTLKMGQNLC